jgi:hypothetical protein
LFHGIVDDAPAADGSYAGAAGTGAAGAFAHVFAEVAIEFGGGVDAAGATGAFDTTLRVGDIGCCGPDVGPYVGGGIGIVLFGGGMNGSSNPGRVGVTPGESRRRMCGVIMTTSSVLFF